MGKKYNGGTSKTTTNGASYNQEYGPDEEL